MPATAPSIVPFASLHDLGLGCHEADLVIDGSLNRNAHASDGETLSGPRFAVLDPSLLDDVRRCLEAAVPRSRRDPSAVLVAFGAGPRAELALDIAESIVAAHPRARVRSDAAMRRHLARMGARLIDGRGAFRAAAAVSRLARAGGTR